MMNRSIRRAMRWTLVVTLATFLSMSPASAGWLLKRMHGNRDASTCCDPCACCPPAPVLCEPVSCEPVCCETAPACPPAAPMVVDECCGESVPMMGVPMMGESIIHEGPIHEGPIHEGHVYESAPMTEFPPMDMTPPPALEDVQVVESPQLETTPEKAPAEKAMTEKAEPGKTTAAKPPGPIDDLGSSVVEPTTEPSPFNAPPVPATPKKTPAPISEPEADMPAESVDDLFGAPAEEPVAPGLFDDAPAMDSPASGEAEPDAGLDDLFGAPDDSSAMPADEPGLMSDPTPADGGLDDLFGAPAEQSAMPADEPFSMDDPAPADPVPADPVPAEADLDDLFGAPAKEAPAMETPADGGLDDLFGEPPAMETPAAPADGGLDDLFGEPPAKESSDLDDLFGQSMPPVAPEMIQTPEPSTSVVSEVVDEPTSVLDQTVMRTWVDNTGTFRTEGRLIQINATNIRLLKSNGKTCTVPMNRLSPEDSVYVASITEQMETFVVAMMTR